LQHTGCDNIKNLVLSETMDLALIKALEYVEKTDEIIISNNMFTLTTDKSTYIYDVENFLDRDLSRFNFDLVLVDQNLNLETNLLEKITNNIVYI